MTDKRNGREKRQSSRREIRISALILTPQGQRYPCEIGDVSETGALILLETPHKLPNQFMLEIGGNAVRRRCNLTRQEGATAGVRFLDRST